MRRFGATVVALALFGGAPPAPAHGQQLQSMTDSVRLVGSSDVALDRRLARLLERDPIILTANTRIRPGDTIRGSVLLLDATLIHEGRITGDLVIVDAGAFVRHEASVGGDLVNIGGGLYRSELARIGGTIIDLPDAPYRVVRAPDVITIEATESPVRLTTDGFFGLRTPTYDRVNGVGLTWGARYRLPRVFGATPNLRGHVGWRTELGAPLYGGSLTLRTGSYTLEAAYRSHSATADNWIIGDLRNSLNYLWDGDDFRNYYDADRASVRLIRAFGDEAKSFFAELHVAGRVEDATSRGGDDPWHLLDGTPRANPAIDDGRISSALAGIDATWHGRTTDLLVGIEYEAGRTWMDGAYTFDRVAAWANFAMQGLFDHTLEIGVFGQAPLGQQDTLPRQRWSIVGGATTLPTLTIGTLRGDRVAFVETRYRIPTPDVLGLPVLGAPELHLTHAAGRAWLAGDDGSLTQEIGARLQFFGPYVAFSLQPSDPDRNAWLVGVSWPFTPGYPWER